MPTFVVLLRGVNVGKAKRVPMADFKVVLQEIGCSKVTTLLNSGNAVVEHPKATSPTLAKKIAIALAKRFDFDVPVIIKSSTEFKTIIQANSIVIAEEEHPRLLVAFAQTAEPITSLDVLSGAVAPREKFLRQECAAYLYCANGILESEAAKALLGKIGKAVTTRNWATVLKLQELASPNAT